MLVKGEHYADITVIDSHERIRIRAWPNDVIRIIVCGGRGAVHEWLYIKKSDLLAALEHIGMGEDNV